MFSSMFLESRPVYCIMYFRTDDKRGNPTKWAFVGVRTGCLAELETETEMKPELQTLMIGNRSIS